MISAPITDMTTMYAGNSFSQSYSGKANKDAKGFDEIISNVTVNSSVDVNDANSVNDAYIRKNQEMTNDMANMASDNSNKIADKNVNKTDSDSKDNSKVESKTDKIKSENNVDTNSVSNDNALSDEEESAVSDAILNEVAEDLDISVEDLEKVLEGLGLTAFDLLNPQNVVNVVAEIKADGDTMPLVTDEALSNLIPEINNDINSTLQAVSDDLGITIDELMTKIDNLAKESQELNSNVTTTDINIAVNEKVSQVKDEVKISDNQTLEKYGDIESVEDNSEITETVSVDNKAESEAGNNSSSNENNSLDKHDNKLVNEHVSVYAQQQNINQVSFENIVEAQVNENVRGADTADIINQIQEHLKMQFKEDVTELEMQLNPENLGTVNLTLASRETGVTAHLTAQNEAVKNALEAQVILLKQNLEEQGVKVEAVEVTVASHEFERNLDKGNDNNSSQEEEAEKLRKATRKLNLDDISADEDIEGLDEELQVTAKMMKADGTSMDYKV